jgi:hypothetical protein
MDIINQAEEFAKDFIANNPQHKEEVIDLLQLMIDEIEGGESAYNELNLFEGACNDLLLKD